MNLDFIFNIIGHFAHFQISKNAKKEIKPIIVIKIILLGEILEKMK